MIYFKKKINELNNSEVLKDSNAFLTSYVLENYEEININYKRPAVVVCPGGAYEFLSDREADVIAQGFNGNDISAFVLRYSIEKEKIYPTQLLEVSAAVAYVRENAEKFNIDPNKIIICGFSAGGHLAGNLGVSWQEDFIAEELNIQKGLNKPNGMILGYPVITGGEYAHEDSFKNLLGKNYNEENCEKLSLQNLVTKNTPKTFIWHTFADPWVPVENTIFFINALKKNDIEFELHIYPQGAHGLSLAEKSTANVNEPGHVNPHVASWFKLAVEWVNTVV